MDYRATLDYLDQVQQRGIKLGLQNMSVLLAGLGEPQQAFPAVVVAGTNGKGSVSAFLASILKAAGIRTGLYTSPHLIRYEERIQVDGAPLSSGEFAAAVSAVRQRVEELTSDGTLASHPTHFEILTAAAFHHFRLKGIDAGVMEVGMGGRLDAVAAARTCVAVITNISLEHTKFLGDSVAAIASEKAGIIKEGCTVVTAETQPEALAVIRDAARGRGVRLVERHADALVTPSARASSGRFVLSTRTARYGEVVLPLAGRHQVENATLAALAAEALAEAAHAPGGLPFTIPVEAVVEGLAAARWPGRLQVAGQEPILLLDGAHNPAGCAALARALRDMRDAGTFGDLHVVFGVLQDKELEPMLAHILPLAKSLILTRGESDRFRDPREVARLAAALGAECLVAEGLQEAIATARRRAGRSGGVCLCGSLYLVGDALKLLKIDPYC